MIIKPTISNARLTAKRLFQDHPASVGETYFGHMGFAFWFSGKLLKAGAAAFVHALFPFWCATTASRTIRELSLIIEARK